MTSSGKGKKENLYSPKDLLSDEDVYEAMKLIPGYLDISLNDFRELYLLAVQHAEKRIREKLKVEAVMTEEVISVDTGTPVHEVAALMAEHDITGLPVINSDNTVAGVISREDFFAGLGEGKNHSIMALLAECLVTKGCAALSMKGKTAADIMSSPAVTVSPGTLLSEAAGLMAEKGVAKLPVTDDKGRLVGFLSRPDLIKFFPFRC
ncbi:MAG: CBS domain-containing protein [Desulfurivibrionaceae bacterium]